MNWYKTVPQKNSQKITPLGGGNFREHPGYKYYREQCSPKLRFGRSEVIFK
jgi:hypothetical protein